MRFFVVSFAAATVFNVLAELIFSSMDRRDISFDRLVRASLLSAAVIGFFVVLMGLSGCAGKAPEPVASPKAQAQLTPGLRPEKECGEPPTSYEGISWRFDEACLFIPGGPASCTYMGEVDIGARWLCAIGLRQDACGAPWVPSRIACDAWDPRYETFLQQLREQAAEVKP